MQAINAHFTSLVAVILEIFSGFAYFALFYRYITYLPTRAEENKT